MQIARPTKFRKTVLSLTNGVQYINGECWKITEIYLEFVYLIELLSNCKPLKRQWSNILKQFVANSRRIVWVCKTILWSWRFKGYVTLSPENFEDASNLEDWDLTPNAYKKCSAINSQYKHNWNNISHILIIT